MTSETIWKYPLNLVERQLLQLPKGAVFLAGQVQGGKITLWYQVDPHPEVPVDLYAITLVGTGHVIPMDAGRYLTTVQTGPYVWHLYGKVP